MKLIKRRIDLELCLISLEAELLERGVILHNESGNVLFPVYHLKPGTRPTADDLDYWREEMGGQGSYICWLRFPFEKPHSTISVGFYLDDVGIQPEHITDRVFRAAADLLEKGNPQTCVTQKPTNVM